MTTCVPEPNESPDGGSPVVVLGIGAEGWDGVGIAGREALGAAGVILGSSRQLSLVPTGVGGERVPWPRPLLPSLPELLARHADRHPVVLASGDPLISGIGSTVISLLGAEAVRVIPAVSSVALARARMGWPAESVEVISSVGRDPAAVLRALHPGARVLVLSADADTPAAVAGLLNATGYGPTVMTVLGDLGSTTESCLTGTAADWSAAAPALNVLALACVAESGRSLLPTVPGLPDDAFEHDGQITKREARATALAHLAPVPGQLLWDIGAGAGSVAIEWTRTHPTCRAVAVERDAERARRIERNAHRLGVPTVTVVVGDAPQILDDMPSPDAIFVGGGATAPGLIDTCHHALSAGGRLVAHAVTLETEAVLVAACGRYGGELVRLSVERAQALGSFTGWTPQRAIVQWSVVR